MDEYNQPDIPELILKLLLLELLLDQPFDISLSLAIDRITAALDKV